MPYSQQRIDSLDRESIRSSGYEWQYRPNEPNRYIQNILPNKIMHNLKCTWGIF